MAKRKKKLAKRKPRAKIENVQRTEDLVASLNTAALVAEKYKLEARVKELEEQLQQFLQKREFVPVDLGDPMPKDSKERRLMVGGVAGLFITILKPKLRLMIAKVREELEKTDNSHQDDLTLKGTSYALWEIIRWGDQIVAEDAAFTSGENAGAPEK